MVFAITFAFVFGACWNYYVSITKNIFDNALANSVFRNILAVALFALAYFAGFGSLMEFVGKIKTRSIFKESLICRLCKFYGASTRKHHCITIFMDFRLE